MWQQKIIDFFIHMYSNHIKNLFLMYFDIVGINVVPNSVEY